MEHAEPTPDTTTNTAAEPRPQSAGDLFRRLGPAGIAGIIATVLPPLGGLVLAIYAGPVSAWLKGNAELGPLIYVCAFAVLAGLALLPTYIQSGLGGFAFGITIGVPAALAGFAGGSLIGYLVARRASGDRVVRLIQEKPKWAAVRDALIGREGTPAGFWRTLGIVSLLRLPPNSPFALTNLVMASVRVPLPAFLLGTLIGMTPRTAAAVAIGAGLKEFSKGSLERASLGWVFWTGIAVTTVVAVIIGMVANRAIKRMGGTTTS